MGGLRTANVEFPGHYLSFSNLSNTTVANNKVLSSRFASFYIKMSTSLLLSRNSFGIRHYMQVVIEIFAVTPHFVM